MINITTHSIGKATFEEIINLFDKYGKSQKINITKEAMHKLINFTFFLIKSIFCPLIQVFKLP